MGSRFGIGATVAVLVGCGVIVGTAIRADARPAVRISVPVSDERRPDDHILPGSGGWPYDPRTIVDWGVADEFDIDVQLVSRVTGKGTMGTLLDNNADIAFVAGAPIITAIANRDDLLVLAQTERSHRQIHLVARADHADDWIEQPIGLVPSTVFETALIAEIDHAGRIDSLVDGSIDVIGAPNPFAVLNSLVDGTVSSALLPQPQAAMLTSWQDGDADATYVDLTTPGLYEFDGFLVTTKSRWAANRDAILLALAATKRTRMMIAEDPERYLRRIHNHEAGASSFRDSPPWFWSADELVFTTDRQELRDALSGEAELQVLAGKISAVPDFSAALAVIDEVSTAVEREVAKVQ